MNCIISLAGIARLLGAVLIGDDRSVTGFNTDSRRLERGELFIALKGPNFDGHDFLAVTAEKGACGAFVDHKVDVDLPQIIVPDTRLALGRLGALWRDRFSGVLVALTGSNGKTTVKEMIKSILQQKGEVLATRGNLNNDIGVPLTLLGLNEAQRYAVVEMGANHPGEIAYLTTLARPDVALLTNAGPAHLEGFGDLEGVARAKGEIFQGLKADAVAVINRDDAYADYWLGLAAGKRIIGFGLERPVEVSGKILSDFPNRFRLDLGSRSVEVELSLLGRHNVRNALAAAAAAYAAGASLDEIRCGLESMRGVAGRLQVLAGRYGQTVIDDTYNANPGSLEAAMQSVPAVKKWLVLGDMAELGAGAPELHEQAGRRARSLGFERLYALGVHSRQAVLAFGSGGFHFDSVRALITALDAAVAAAADKPMLLIKGSRSMRMEQIARALTETQPTELEAHF